MPKQICLIQGHPEDSPKTLCAALARSYLDGAKAGGHKVRKLNVAALDVPYLTASAEFPTPPPDQIQEAQGIIAAADHVVFIYPLWLGSMPAKLKAFLEQIARNEFLIKQDPKGGWPTKRMSGKSARVIVTMGMPAAAYQVLFGKTGVKSLEQGILTLSGFKPVRDTLIGSVGAADEKQRMKWLTAVRALGLRGV
jgi:putative NADPH-quinone reductase